MVELKGFLTKFLVLFISLYVFFHLPEIAKPLNYPFPDLLYPVKQLVAFSSAWVLQSLGHSVSLSDLTIQTGAVRFTIISSCTGAVSFSIFAGLLHATPMKNKWKYLLLAVPLFVLWNILRVVLTLSFGTELIEILHNAFWTVSIVIVLGFYILVLKNEGIYLGRDEEK